MCPRGENTQGLLPWVQTLIWTSPRPPRVLSEFLHEGPGPFHLTSGPPKRGPSLQNQQVLLVFTLRSDRDLVPLRGPWARDTSLRLKASSLAHI
jgi:hypothetical protein